MKSLSKLIYVGFLAFLALSIPLHSLVSSEPGSSDASLPSFAEPALSPDRSEIAFVSGGDIWTVPQLGDEV
jgi:tricorn protease